jgi:tripeptidyl-peptidase-2
MVDCSGSGDVAMTLATTVEENGTTFVVGVGGKLLKINPTWRNPTGTFKVGMKVF